MVRGLLWTRPQCLGSTGDDPGCVSVQNARAFETLRGALVLLRLGHIKPSKKHLLHTITAHPVLQQTGAVSSVLPSFKGVECSSNLGFSENGQSAFFSNALPSFWLASAPFPWDLQHSRI